MTTAFQWTWTVTQAHPVASVLLPTLSRTVRFVEVATGAATPSFGVDHGLGCAVCKHLDALLVVQPVHPSANPWAHSLTQNWGGTLSLPDDQESKTVYVFATSSHSSGGGNQVDVFWVWTARRSLSLCLALRMLPCSTRTLSRNRV